MPSPEDARLALAHGLRSAVCAASARLQLTVRHIERGEVDPARLLRELRDLDAQVRRVVALIPAAEGDDETAT
jgi:hypothetical protein